MHFYRAMCADRYNPEGKVIHYALFFAMLDLMLLLFYSISEDVFNMNTGFYLHPR